MIKKDFENKFNCIINRTLIGVKYYEIEYSNKKPMWNWNKDFDSLDYGLDLEFNDKSIWGITWGSEFYQYGISIYQKSIKDILKGYIVWDVTKEINWKKYLNQKIKKVKIYWDEVEEGLKRFKFPQDVKIVFENDNSIYISAYEIRKDGFEMGMMDNITVFFDTKIAQKHNLKLQ